MRRYVAIAFIFLSVLLFGCSSTRYVPKDSYLLTSNTVELINQKDVAKSKSISVDKVAGYIKQRPNKKTLWMNLSLGFYNMTDTAKNDWWHKFWREKIGRAPVIFDSSSMKESSREMGIYLASRGFLRATVKDSVIYKGQKAQVIYKVTQGTPYTISNIEYNIEDPFLKELILPDSTNRLIKEGDLFSRQAMIEEGKRITSNLRDMGFYFFGTSSINYTVDSSLNNNTASVVLNIKRRVSDFGTRGEIIYTNHPIYRISRVIVNTDFDPTMSVVQGREVNYDTLVYNGIEILYVNQLKIRPEVLIQAISFSPNSLFDQRVVQQTNNNIKDLGFSTTMLFSPLPVDHQDMTTVTIPTADGKDAVTTEMRMECLIQCTPIKSKAISEELEVSTTALYSSLALTLGYQNRSLFKGAENFSTSLRGAYELMKDHSLRNSYEIGVITSLSLPRFLPSFGIGRASQIRQKSTKMQLSYSIQERPKYHRTLLGMQFGYTWTNSGGSRIAIYPIDISIVKVPWIDEEFYTSLGQNNYLQNSYKSTMIPGLLATYSYNSNIRYQESGFSIRFSTDVNGNLFHALKHVIAKPTTDNGEEYYTIFGLRYSQYAKASFDYSARHSFSDYAQFSWRVFVGASVPYGNSSAVPFERLFYAGGGNSMRGWPIRSLGPGASAVDPQDSYPNRLGDMRLEFNLEYRFKVWNGLSMATFVDVGNIWMNSKARTIVDGNDDEIFRFHTFGKQLAMNTGLGIRWDFDFFLFRLDWGIKLHNPGMPDELRWFKQMNLKDTALHFALGLPF